MAGSGLATGPQGAEQSLGTVRWDSHLAVHFAVCRWSLYRVRESAGEGELSPSSQHLQRTHQKYGEDGGGACAVWCSWNLAHPEGPQAKAFWGMSAELNSTNFSKKNEIDR